MNCETKAEEKESSDGEKIISLTAFLFGEIRPT